MAAQGWGWFAWRLALLKLAEFAALWAVLSVVTYLHGDKHAPGLIDAARGSLLIAVWIYFYTLYPVFSLIPLVLLRALGVRSSSVLAAAAALVLLAYASLLAWRPGDVMVSTWGSWLIVGLIVFSLTRALLRETPAADRMDLASAAPEK